MSAAKKRDPSRNDISDMYYMTIKEICERTTYDRTTINGFISRNELKSEKKNGGKRVVKVSDFVEWWNAINSR